MRRAWLICLVLAAAPATRGSDSQSADGICSWDALDHLRGLETAARMRAAAAMERVIAGGLHCSAHAGAHGAWQAWKAQHRPAFERVLSSGKLLPPDLVLVCRPFFGLGNRFNALISCAYMALVTNRTLIVDWDGQENDPDAVGAAVPGGSLGDLVGRDVFWQLPPDILSTLLGRAASVGDILEVKQTDTFATQTQHLLCDDIRRSLTASVVVLKTHRCVRVYVCLCMWRVRRLKLFDGW